jgi:hypothetical protein
MYKYIESNASIIRINRGDTFQKPLFINCGTFLNPIRYEIQGNDKVYFGVMEPNHYWEQSILKQCYTPEDEKTNEGDLIIKICPEETEYLIPGTYYYMIKLVRYNDDNETVEVKTVVPATLFVIL